MRKFYLYRLSLSIVFCASIVFLFEHYAYADTQRSTFQQLFGEFADDEHVDPLVKKESKKPGEAPAPSLSNILLSKATLERLNKAINKLEKVVKKGGWPTLEPKGVRLKHGDDNKQIRIVKKLLIKQGDLTRSRVNMISQFDDSLEDSIIRFQKRHGLRTSGYVDRKTRLAMAVSAQIRLGQLLINKKRLKKAMAKVKGSKYVLVNVPDYSLQAVNEGRIELSSRVVVGRQDRQTPDVNTYIEGINFNPFWYVPRSLIKEDLIPNQIKDPNFMKDNYLRVFKEWGGPELKHTAINWRSPEARRYKFRQDPGDHNALGLIRVQMPNKDIVYLHDTPTKKLYGLRARAYSAGCVRVEKIRDLTAWILKGKKDWDRSRVDKVLSSTKRVNAMIPKKIPVQFVYVTGWVDAKGKMNFREDIYGRDEGLKKYASRVEELRGTRTFSP